MQFRTCFSSVCESGYGIDAIKSGIQKYLRRRDASKMKWCVRQMQLFAHGKDESEQQIGKGIITNLINRLIIMLDEEVLFADWNTYLEVRKLIDMFKKNTKEITPLYTICDIMCNARLLRLGSDVACFYGKAINNENPYYEVIGIDELTINEVYNRFIKSDNIEFAYTWAFWLFHNKKELELQHKIYRRSEPVYIIWQYMIAQAATNHMLRTCLEYRLEEFHNKSRPERKLFLVAAVSLFFHRNKINWNKIDVTNICVSPLIEGQFKLDDYVLDMHCKEGRKMGKTTSDFAHEGSVVVNEDKEYYNDEWRQFYIECKMVSAAKVPTAKVPTAKVPTLKPSASNKPTKDNVDFIPMSNFQFIKLCTDTTCGGKAMCFVVEYEGKRYVLKEGRASMNYNEEYEIVDALKPIFGLNSIGMERILSDKVIKKINKEEKSWTNNWMFEDANEVVYTMMTYIEPSYRFNKAPVGLIGEKEELEYMKVGLFRGIVGVTDYNVTNVIINDNKQVYSIDEHNFLGSRDKMIGKMNMRFFKKHSTKIDKIFEDLYEDKEMKKLKLTVTLTDYGYEDKVDQVLKNYDDLANKFWAEYNADM
jgi:hypothetical protein